MVTSTFLEYQFITKIFIWLYILTCKELQHVCENNLPWVCSSLWFVLLVLLYALYKCITLKVSGNNSETETSGEGLMEASFSNNLVFCFLDLCFASCRQCPQLNLLLCNAPMLWRKRNNGPDDSMLHVEHSSWQSEWTEN